MPKPKPRRQIQKRTRKQGRTPQYYKTMTWRMLEDLRKIGEFTSDPEPLRMVEKGTLRGIRDRLVKNPDSWSSADYANVKRIFRKAAGKKAKPE